MDFRLKMLNMQRFRIAGGFRLPPPRRLLLSNTMLKFYRFAAPTAAATAVTAEVATKYLSLVHFIVWVLVRASPFDLLIGNLLFVLIYRFSCSVCSRACISISAVWTHSRTPTRKLVEHWSTSSWVCRANTTSTMNAVVRRCLLLPQLPIHIDL